MKRPVWIFAVCALALVLLVCGGPALLVRAGSLPAFGADIQIWPGATLVVNNTSASACQTASRCMRQIQAEPALSIWLIWQTRRRGNVDKVGRRLLYLPAHR